MDLSKSFRKRFPRVSARSSAWKWLYVGIGVKRWLVVLLAGVTMLALGMAYLAVEFYRAQPFPDFVYYLTLQFLPRLARALLFGAVGFGLVAYGLYRLNQALLAGIPARPSSLVENLYRKRMRKRDLKIVCIGGGTGMSALLRGLKNYSDNLTAIITVADDGGSSGRLRQELGVLPPGDFRQCIAALADAEPLMTRLLEYRFPNDSGLGGHAFGNLLIAAMAGVTGNSERALMESSRVLAVRGRILPSTLENVTLCAEVRGSHEAQTARVSGESQIAKFGKPVERVYLEPAHVPAYPDAVHALLHADLIVVGPGSLYTSVLPNLLVERIGQAVVESSARKIFICNVATERGETDRYAVEDYLRALKQHCDGLDFDGILINDEISGTLPPQAQIEYVQPRETNPVYAFANVVDKERPWRHDSERLARAVLHWYSGRGKTSSARDTQAVARTAHVRQGSREEIGTRER
jgi:uncharacterized cofD-like protein